jgi:CIC family chloride channel protein
MAGLFAAVVRSPLTGAVLMVEMTGSYTLMLSVVAASLAAHAAAAALGSEPIYDSLLARELRRGRGMSSAPAEVQKR